MSAIRSQNYSDYNVTDTISAVVSKKDLYTDLDLSLILDGVTGGDIIPLTDIDAVVYAVKNLVLTNFNERPFQPNVGGNISGMLFEPADRLTIASLRNAIHYILERYEPRIDSVAVDVVDDSDNNRYGVTISFRVIVPNRSVDMTLYLQRLR
jgi:phage baseplate assembly protein W